VLSLAVLGLSPSLLGVAAYSIPRLFVS
jgi:hypothetical protein